MVQVRLLNQLPMRPCHQVLGIRAAAEMVLDCYRFLTCASWQKLSSAGVSFLQSYVRANSQAGHLWSPQCASVAVLRSAPAPRGRGAAVGRTLQPRRRPIGLHSNVTGSDAAGTGLLPSGADFHKQRSFAEHEQCIEGFEE